MVLLPILNPFLTREPRSKGFEGITTEICLRQRADKTDRQTDSMHADRVLGDGSWTRGKRQEARMSLVTNKQVSTGSNSCSNAPRGKMAAQHSRSRSSHRVRTFSSARSSSTQRRRCETADLPLGFSIQIQAWPVLQTRPKSRF